LNNPPITLALARVTRSSELQKEGTGRIYFLNGSFVKAEDARISVLDHGLLYGDGVYEAIRVYDGLVFKLKEHVDRLYESAKSVKIEIGVTREQMIETVIETVRKNQLRNAYVRIVVTRGVGPMGVDPRNCKAPTVVVIVEPRDSIWKERPRGIRAMISSLRRTPPWSLDPRIKTLNYLNNILAKIEAIESGVDEAIMLNSEGYVAEGSTENIFIAKDDAVVTPPEYSGILRGITRNVVVDIAKDLGFEVAERNITMHELFNADEVFVTGTAAEIVPVTMICGRIVGNGEPGRITLRVIDRFREKIKDRSHGVAVYP